MSNGIRNALMTGAGHNGMVAACYLAKAGRRVTVVEAYPFIDGMMATNAIRPEAPLQRVNEGRLESRYCAAGTASANWMPEKFGLAQIVPDPPYTYLQPDGSSLCIWRDPEYTAQELKHFSPRGAKAYLEFVSSISLMMEFVLRLMRSRPTRVNVLIMAIWAVMHPLKPWGMTRLISSIDAACICVLSNTSLPYPREQA